MTAFAHDSMFAQRRDDGAVVLTFAKPITSYTLKPGSVSGLQIAYCGTFEKNGEAVELTADVLDELIASVADLKSDIPADYEHLMFKPSATPEQKKASAWFAPSQLKRIGEGDDAQLWVSPPPKWTKLARKMLDDDEYRYPSIAFMPRKDGKPARFLNFALTNMPFLDGVPAIQCNRESMTMADDTTTAPADEEKKKDEPTAMADDEAAVTDDASGDDAAEMGALLDMFAKGLAVDRKGAMEWLAKNAEKIMADGQSAVTASDDTATADAEKTELKKLNRDLTDKNEKLTLLNRSLDGRVKAIESKLKADEDAKAKSESEAAVVAFTREIDAKIASCHVHEAEKPQALALFSKLPDDARKIYLSREHTVVPTAKVEPEPAAGAAAQPKVVDGRVVIELSRLNPQNREVFDALVRNRAMSDSAAYSHLLSKQSAEAAE